MQIVVSLIFYAGVIDSTIIVTLNGIASEKSKVTETI